ncbi:type I-E CRISPR-associated protein Cse2/CasB [Lactobacillus iners]|jgi:CRISPR system CASCADE complex protein casB|uniref:CRISPR system CASCADE complex protein CasB n=2 Tax=Lactobacillus iners TaxID=147802 RepID=E1NRT9_9LACO|nr:type I-E CRISPR-associated protein Cse2/CasB [Lactobacillus iners]EFO71164.1 CRISPR system CASCADE complex protein CasB [Lactobacillus iners LactinV 01V1-a]EFQ47715.1 CRISPR system CASCADE complex protein CasB [Lactobacillus iners LEAF 2053A-b]MCT7685632.1 type I-E CRISPR-associated protein Cse2/CasB [Lactobacillus iners]MCT7718753.1 type I-E CRISPR-associated protein Cse2/CasB [Lactobacillus iners]MCT7727482.1 type I-E CRISPR-associated protein Cse2/CasB [Lactobacillus iners]
MEGSNVYNVTAKILRKINQTKDTSSTRALFANIRNSINKSSSNNLDALAFVFNNMPEEYIGFGKELSDYEQAILTAIQMYALHQQSNEKSVLKIEYNEGEKRQNLGDALSTLRGSDNKSIDRRFNAMILSSNYLQLQNHLRQFIKLLKAKSDAKVDYASVADDLFWFLKNQKDGVKIKWSRSYYKFRKVNDKGEN